MKLKEFVKSIDHRFRDAVPVEGTVVAATLINWSNDPVGTAVYDTESQDVLKITVSVGDDTHEWDGTGNISEIMSLLIGQIESTTQHLDELDLDRVVEQFTAAPVPVVQESSATQIGYTVNITATFTMVVDSATMDAALSEAKGRLKFPDHVQYKINKESVEKCY
jgi:hypothetical protein